MVRISRLATAIALGSAVEGLTIPDVDKNGVQIAIGFDPKAAFKVDGKPDTKIVNYDINTLKAMGDLTASPSNVTSITARQIGNDDRVNWNDSSWPYSALGKLSWSNGAWCSATLVGPRHIVTARHCTPRNGEDVSLRFSPFYYDGETRYQGSQVAVYIWTGQDEGDCLYGQDWAIHILQDRIGEQQGYFGARAIDQGWLNRNIFDNFGYPGDRNNGERPIKSSGGTMQFFGSCGDDNPVWGDIDVAGGQSGGSFWEANDPYVMGTLYGANSQNSVWASGQSLVNAIVSARNDFP